MKALLWWGGASWSVSDVASGIQAGLEHAGVTLSHYKTHDRIVSSGHWLHSVWRRQNKLRAEQGIELLRKPTEADACRHACEALVTRAMRLEVDWVVCVSGLWLDTSIFAMLRRAGIKVAFVATESPYQTEWELRVASEADHVWTNERTCVPKFQHVCPSVSYLRHAWHPAVHTYGMEHTDVAKHDVVFVGTAFPERIEILKAINWDGIDLGLYGYWAGVPSRSPLRKYIKSGVLPNTLAAALYRNARIGLNLHRTSEFRSKDVSKTEPVIHHREAESLNPRAYELAACGVFQIADFRPEVVDVFGDRVPTFRSPAEAESLIRHWLADDAGRVARADEMRACVQGDHWYARGAQMLADLASAERRKAA